MTDEKLAELMQDARIINASEHLLFPMIEKMIEIKVDVMCALFRQGKTELVGEAAYISALKDLLSDLKSKKMVGGKAFKELMDKKN